MSNYPEHEKFEPLQDQANTINNFIEWLEEKGWCIAQWDKEDEGFWSVGMPKEAIIAEFLGIDLVKFRAEKEQIYREIKNASASTPG